MKEFDSSILCTLSGMMGGTMRFIPEVPSITIGAIIEVSFYAMISAAIAWLTKWMIDRLIRKITRK